MLTSKFFSFSPSLSRYISTASPVILGYKRTPVIGAHGALAGFSAPTLGSLAVKDILKNFPSILPNSVIFGQASTSGCGQNPARQCIFSSNLPSNTIGTIVSKGKASGIKSILLSTTEIISNYSQCSIAGGFENMSQFPLTLPWNIRISPKNLNISDSLEKKQNFKDPLNTTIEGNVNISKHFEKISKEMISQYQKKCQNIKEDPVLKEEIVPITLPSKKKGVEIPPLTIDNIKPSQDGDGSAAILLSSSEFAQEHGLTPLFRILAFGESSSSPFHLAQSIHKALNFSKLRSSDIDEWVLDETDLHHLLSIQSFYGISLDNLNVLGGSLVFGNSLGGYGSMMFIRLLSTLKYKKQRYGLVGVSGDQESVSMVVERV